MDWQVEGAGFLARRTQALLADEPGLGKSCQAIRACDLVGAENILILVPASVRVNWLREFEKFSLYDRQGVAILDGKTAPSAKGLTVCSYDLLANAKLRKSLSARQWDVLILDETHMLKTRSASRTKWVYGRKADGTTGLASVSARVWRLSGTPAPNHVDEVWTHLRSSGLFSGSYHEFVDKYCTGFTSDFGFRITGTKNAQHLRTLLQPFMLRRKKADVMPKLPPITIETHTIEPSAVDIEVYFPNVILTGAGELHREIEAQNAKLRGMPKDGDAVIDYLRQMSTSAGTLRKYIGLSKVPGYLAKIRPELRERRYDKLIIGAWHSDVIELLHRELREFNPVILYGGTPAEKRQVRIDKFKDNKACRVMICQVKVGIGFNATAAYTVDVLEPSWVPAENKQLIDRCHRIGQDAPVTARFFGCGRSIDEDIAKALALKAKELAKVFE
jgi:SNF2 family DNA or RNA helicase